MSTNIEWAHDTVNIVAGCSKVSPGCLNCYAERFANRLANIPTVAATTRAAYAKVVKDGKWNGKVVIIPGCMDRLRKAAKTKRRDGKPKRIFVQSMGDLFHDDVSDELRDLVFGVVPQNGHNNFLVLTKRPDKMKVFMDGYQMGADDTGYRFPWLNLWPGATIENQEQADKRVGYLLQIPAAVRYVSVEPMLGPVDLSHYLWFDGSNGGQEHHQKHGWSFDDYSGGFAGKGDIAYDPQPGLDWCIVGGETGPGARPMHPGWVRGLRDQCVAAGVPFFFKSWGDWKEGSDARRTTKCVYRDGTVVDFDRESLLAEELKSGIPHNKRGGTLMARVGKKAAGNELDGRTWQQVPGRGE